MESKTAERIKKLRDSSGLTQEELGEKLGLAAGTISKWERGQQEVGKKSLIQYSNFFHVTTDYLLGRTDDPKTFIPDKDYTRLMEISGGDEPELADIVYKYIEDNPEILENFVQDTDKIKHVQFVPVIDGIIRASAGNGNGYPNVTWNEVGTMPIPKDDLIGYSWQGAQYYIISVDGDSMEPYICNGDKLLFAAGIDVAPGEVAVVLYDDVIWVKGVLTNKDGTVTLISFNKNYPDRIIDPQQHEFHILGKALRVVSSKRIPSTI